MGAVVKMLRFSVLCIAMAALYWFLFGLLLLSPESLFRDLGIPESAIAAFIARRAAMLMAGFAVLTSLGWNAGSVEARSLICVSVTVSMLGLAITGIHALQTGFVGQGFVVSIIVELAFALLFLLALISGRKAAAWN